MKTQADKIIEVILWGTDWEKDNYEKYHCPKHGLNNKGKFKNPVCKNEVKHDNN